MGVINITPNSFSDHIDLNNISSFSDKFNELLNWADCIDLGAESTAPFNSPLGSVEELERFETYFFPFVASTKDPKITISIDTYKPEVFYEVYLVIKKYWPKTKIIFNDVSGKIDDELILLLSDDSLDFDYVFSHNLCPSRDMTVKHMDYCLKDLDRDLVAEMIHYFQIGLELVKPLKRRIWIDPCFGFSKTREQNHYLLKNIHYLLEGFPSHIGFIYGISRKSFLRVPRNLNPKDPSEIKVLDQMQAILITDLLRNPLKRDFYFRVHDYSSLKSSFNIMSILE